MKNIDELVHRLRLAQLLGFTDIKPHSYKSEVNNVTKTVHSFWGWRGGKLVEVPDYLHDFNACLGVARDLGLSCEVVIQSDRPGGTVQLGAYSMSIYQFGETIEQAMVVALIRWLAEPVKPLKRKGERDA